MTRIEQARVLIRVARNLLVVERETNQDLDTPDAQQIVGATLSLENADGELFPFAPDMGEALELGGNTIEPLEIGG